jgi:ADP-ribose pyrophosphatase YjhB (NUDIX family)
MDSIVPPIRNTARALILQDNNILLLRKDGYEQGERFALPGGGQDLGETLEQALHRECLEEIGSRIEIHRLVLFQATGHTTRQHPSPGRVFVRLYGAG